MKAFQRFLSFWMAACILISMLPVSVMAEEVENTQVTSAAEETVVTEESAPAEESSAPTVEPVTEQTGETAAPAEAMTETSKEPIAPTEDEETVEETVSNETMDYSTVIASGWCGDRVKWSLDDKGKVVISGTGPMDDNTAFLYHYRDSVLSAEIEDGVTRIGEGTFDFCRNLKSVTIGDDVTNIGSFAFAYCYSLTSIEFPDNLESVGPDAFRLCTGLKSIAIKDKVTSLYYSFTNCDNIEEIFYGGTKSQWSSLGKYSPPIADLIHYNCTEFLEEHWKSIEMETTCTADGFSCERCSCGYERNLVITGSAFGHTEAVSESVSPTCTKNGLTEGTHCATCGKVLASQTVIPALGHDMGQWTIIENPTCTTIGIQSRHCNRCDHSEEEVMDALGHNLGQWEIIKESTCTEDGRRQRKCGRCDHLETQVIEASHNFAGGTCTVCGAKGGTCGDNLTWALDDEGTLTISGTGSMDHYYFEGSMYTPWYNYQNAVLSVMIEYGVTFIGNEAFRACGNLKNVEIPESVEDIGYGAFMACRSLTDIDLPYSLTSIGCRAFYNCTSLNSIEIPYNVRVIDDETFSGCSNLNSVYYCYHEGVTGFGQNAFRNCYNLEDFYYSGTSSQWSALSRRPNADRMHYSSRPWGHWSKVREESTDATCTLNGYTYERCSCGHERGRSVSALGHNMGQWQITREAACTVDGEKIRTCTRCDYFETQAIAAIGHTEVIDGAVAPTCTQTGLTQGSHCDLCGEVFTAQEEIPALGHSHEAVVTPPACTEDGFTTHTCTVCGDTYVDSTVDKLGHTEVIDESVAPGCTETGLTEGRHCSVCQEVLVAQEVISALGHCFETDNDRIVCAACGEELYARILQDCIALDLQVLQSTQLEVEFSRDDLREFTSWTIEGDEGIASVDQNGFVTALGEGTVYVVATLSYSDLEVTSRCRIDVTETLQLEGIQLNTTKVTTELFRTDYATFEILLQLPQNYTSAVSTYSLRGQHHGVAIEGIRFTDAAAAACFELVALDDRTVMIVPTEYAVSNPKAVKSSYKSSVTVTVQGQEYTTDELTLTVKKSTPKLKATVSPFNSFYSGQSQAIVITGGTVMSISEDASKTTAIPTWLSLENGILTLKPNAPLKNASGNACLLVETEEWAIPAAVTLSVKNVYKVPGLKLSAGTVIFTTLTDSANGVELKLLPKNSKDTLASLNVKGITAPDGYTAGELDADGGFTLKAPDNVKKGKIILNVSFHDTTVKLPLTLNVGTAEVKLKPNKTSITLNTAVNDSAVIQVTATPTDYRIDLEQAKIRLTDSTGKIDKTGELEIAAEGNQITLKPVSTTKGTYKLHISAGGSKEAAVTIKTVSAVPTVTFKAKGNLDLSFPDQYAEMIPTLKNYNGEIRAVELIDATGFFRKLPEDQSIRISCQEATPVGTYTLRLKLTLADNSTIDNTVKVTVKRTAVKLKLSAAKLTLNKSIEEAGSVTVSCTTKGYDFVEPVCKLMDKTGKKEAPGKLDIRYKDGKLTVGANTETEYGATYKILVMANDKAPTQTLTVTILARNKSTITASLKVSGKIDVIRDGSAVTVTPSYKNCLTGTKKTEKVFIFSSRDGYTEDVSHLFEINPNGKGGHSITRAEGAQLDHTLKYKVKVVTTIGNTNVESAKVSMSVAMGSAALTLAAENTTLFAKDRNDRAVFQLNARDAALNEVIEVEIKEAKHQDIFEILDYGDGTYAVAFRDRKVHSSLIGKTASKTVTLTLNVCLEGNQTTKVNTTVKLKLTILK